MQKPSPIIYPGPFNQYIDAVREPDLSDAFNMQLPVINGFLSAISEEKSRYAYAVSKWTIKELLQHMIDTERIFSYRALSIARGELQSLPGFDENAYAATAHGNGRSWHSLGNEFLIVRQATHLLFNSFTNDMLMTEGHFSNRANTAAGCGFIILGHFYHHKKVIEERYF
ncbi:MAG TPA: DinB family protein [Ferruginibacter sp.]|nr:DinB family protein [Ferruginibacter sp.]